MPSSKLDDYIVIETVGSGSYGTCKKIRRKCDGKNLVWKELNYGQMSEAEKQMLVSEVNLLRELRHNNIVRYYDRIIDRTKTTIYIVMEHCEKGDLSNVISKYKRDRKFIEEQFVWKVLYQLSLALQECHRKKGGGHILHRDLKPANVFIDSDGNVKLGDFGLARVLNHDTSFAKTFVGTPYYMSPEQVSKMSYNEKSDIWSLGCLLYELCALHPPFLAMDQRALAVKIRDGRFKPIPNHFSDELSEFIKWMLQVSDECRPSIDEILRHSSVLKYANIFVTKERKSSTVDSTSSPRASHLRRKEEALKTKEKLLQDKEKELDRRERLLFERETLAEEKLTRMEKLLLDANGRPNERPLNLKRPKHSEVRALGKENDYHYILQERKRACSDTDRLSNFAVVGNDYSRNCNQGPRNILNKLENFGVKNKLSDIYMGRK